MSERSKTLVQQWLQQSSIDDERLLQLAADNPFFSAAQLLLLQRLDAGSEKFAAQKKVAALHLYNPIQLDASDFSFDWNEPVNEALLVTETEPEPTSLEEKEIETFADADEAPTLAEQEFIKAAPEAAATPDNSQKENETFAAAGENEITRVKQEEFYEEGSNDTLIEKNAPDEFPTESNTFNRDENPDAENEVPTIRMPSFDLNAPVNAAAGNITFEPFHTVDYFASQGIKLSQAEAGNDRFGKQVKSFTEWLKTMKKLPATAITHNTDGAGESKVANLAIHSLQNADVVTESMAEVWVKQGNIQKASEVYNKLSLQNPSKKAYFAAKIESLKKPS